MSLGVSFAGVPAAPRVVLRATHEGALAHCSLADPKRFAIGDFRFTSESASW
jgi:hypothetical protein